MNGCTQIAILSVSSINTASVDAGPDQTIMEGNNLILNASGVVSYNWISSPDLSCANCPNPLVYPLQTSWYYVIRVDSNQFTAIDSVLITVNEDCQEIFIPNVFSPNNHGENDLECVFGNCIKNIYFAIYNRWGQKMFETVDYRMCWDGKHRGKPLDSDVYTYQINSILK